MVIVRRAGADKVFKEKIRVFIVKGILFFSDTTYAH
jgi:hypothetical protein